MPDDTEQEQIRVVRVSVELLPDAPAEEVLAAIRVADESAIDTVFCVDEVYHRDAWLLLAAAARNPVECGWRRASRT